MEVLGQARAFAFLGGRKGKRSGSFVAEGSYKSKETEPPKGGDGCLRKGTKLAICRRWTKVSHNLGGGKRHENGNFIVRGTVIS